MAGYTVIEADQGRLRLLPIDGGHEVDVVVPTPVFPQRLVPVTNAVVWVGSGRVRVLKKPFGGPVADIGPADNVIASVNPGLFWIVRGHYPAPLTIQLGCVDGGGVACGPELSPPVAVPEHLVPVADAGNVVILTSPGGTVPARAVAWDPFAGATKFRFPASFRDVIDTHGNLVAWRGRGPDGCTIRDSCALHLTDMAAGSDQTISPPAGLDGFIEGGAFSPDGTRLAAFGADATNIGTASPVIVYVPSASSQKMDGVVAITEPIGAAVWDPLGNAVFVAGSSGSLVAYRVDSPTPIELNFPSSYTIAVQ